MTSSWKEAKLQDIALINPIEPLKKGELAKKVPMDVLKPFCKKIPAYSIEKYNGGTKFRNGDTIMARITPCLENGKTAKVDILDNNEIGFGSTEYIVFRAIDNKINPDYLYYLITSAKIREPAIKSMVGTSGRQRVQTDVVKNLNITLPPIKTQQKIAHILSTLDDKIELNNRINENLEQQASAIFKSWFVDLEPFNGVMPKDWKIARLTDIAQYLNGLAMQKFKPKEDEKSLPVLKIKELRQRYCDINSDLCSININPNYIVNNGDVIFSWSGTLLLDFWCGGKCGLNQHLFKVTSKKYHKWFYYYWTKHHLDKFILIAIDKATTMGHIKREDLEKSEVLIPEDKIYNKVNDIIKPIIEKIISNRVENRALIELRDTLLPRLMDGKLQIKE